MCNTVMEILTEANVSEADKLRVKDAIETLCNTCPTRTGEVCERCGTRYDYCWQVPDEIWLDVVGKKEGHLCLPCFTRLAHAKGHARLCWDGRVEVWAGGGGDFSNAKAVK